MNSLRLKLNELNKLIIDLHFLEALDKFYDDNVVTHENENPPIVGLPDHKNSASEFLGNITNYHAELLNTIVSEEITVSEWHYLFDHVKWGTWDVIQISVQRWKDSKIIHERHYYTK